MHLQVLPKNVNVRASSRLAGNDCSQQAPSSKNEIEDLFTIFLLNSEIAEAVRNLVTQCWQEHPVLARSEN